MKDEPSFCYVSVRVVNFNSVPNVLKWEQLQNTLPLWSPSFTGGFEDRGITQETQFLFNDM